MSIIIQPNSDKTINDEDVIFITDKTLNDEHLAGIAIVCKMIFKYKVDSHVKFYSKPIFYESEYDYIHDKRGKTVDDFLHGYYILHLPYNTDTYGMILKFPYYEYNLKIYFGETLKAIFWIIDLLIKNYYDATNFDYILTYYKISLNVNLSDKLEDMIVYTNNIIDLRKVVLEYIENERNEVTQDNILDYVPLSDDELILLLIDSSLNSNFDISKILTKDKYEAIYKEYKDDIIPLIDECIVHNTSNIVCSYL